MGARLRSFGLILVQPRYGLAQLPDELGGLLLRLQPVVVLDLELVRQVPHEGILNELLEVLVLVHLL